MSTERNSMLSVFDQIRKSAEKETNEQQIREAIGQTQRLISALELSHCFSENESVEEISTTDLRFLLVPYYYAMMLQKLNDEVSERLAHLQDSLNSLNLLLTRLWTYGLCGTVAKELYKDEESLMRDDNGNLEFRRTSKIQRLRREKFLESEISRFQALSSSKTKFEEDAKEYSWVDGLEEEHERKVWILYLEMTFYKALTQRELILQETEILEFAKTKPRRTEIESKIPQQLNTVVESLQRRNNIQKQIFQPSHQLPKMTVEEFAAIEEKRARQQASKSGEPSAEKQEDIFEEQDDDAYKARAWDDWKDDHPYGYGNSKLKPCAQ